MDQIFRDFAYAYNKPNDGYTLASTISPEPPRDDPARLYAFHRSSNPMSIETDLRYKLQYNPELRLERKEATAWLEVFLVFYRFTGTLLAAEEAENTGRPHQADWNAVYDGWREMVNALYKGYQSNVFGAWTIPCLYGAGKYLRIFAIKADAKASARDSGIALGAMEEEDSLAPESQNEKLEDAARHINRVFGLCISDRNPLEDSRKWALYYVANLLFKTYFKLNHVSLCKNILRSLRAAVDVPPLESFPPSHQVTHNYYCGVIHFLEEDYPAAEAYLTAAHALCHAGATRNIQLILTYLIPTRLLTSHRLPTAAFLAPYPRLASLFTPITASIRAGDLAGFNAALDAGEPEFVKRRIYLTLERGRDVALRNLFRNVFLAGGFDAPKEGDAGPPVRRTRVPVREFAAALRLAGADVDGEGEGVREGCGTVDMEEVECLISNAIYKNLMKGYIARDRGIVVLSKGGAFPGTGV